MKKYLFPISASVVVALATAASAQRPAGSPAAQQPTPNPAAQAPATVAVPMSKMALISSDAFLDPKTGIAKFSTVLNKLNGEFAGVKNELTQMQTRGQQLEDEIGKLQNARSEEHTSELQS